MHVGTERARLIPKYTQADGLSACLLTNGYRAISVFNAMFRPLASRNGDRKRKHELLSYLPCLLQTMPSSNNTMACSSSMPILANFVPLAPSRLFCYGNFCLDTEGEFLPNHFNTQSWHARHLFSKRLNSKSKSSNMSKKHLTH